MRKTAYGNLLKGFQTFSLLDIKKDFAFHSIQDCFEFLKEQNAIFVKTINPVTQKIENQIDCKASITGSNCYFPPTTTNCTLPSSTFPRTTLTSKSSEMTNGNGKKSKNERHEKNGKNKKNGIDENNKRNFLSSKRRVTQSSSLTSSTTFPNQIGGLTSRSHSKESKSSYLSNSLNNNTTRQVNLTTNNKAEENDIVTKKRGGSKRGNILLLDDASVSSNFRKDDNYPQMKVKQRKIELILS